MCTAPPQLRIHLRDPSTIPLNFTKSINLALSERGINSMRRANCPELLDSVLNETIPMYGRMIHGSKNGTNYEEAQAYDVHGRAILAVDRHSLNKRLLDELENMPNVRLLFNHKLVGADFKKNLAWFEDMTKKDQSDPFSGPTTASGNREIEIKFDFMIGADGAHSAVRYHMMKFTRMDYTQEYIDTLWCEFHIKPDTSNTSKHDGFKISPNHLHIWPGGSFMFIAIPSLDKSFTSTLFLPADGFAEINAEPATRLVAFFQKHFPGVVPDLISEEDLQRQYAENPHLPLISIKCSPYHHGSSAVILGDAAHAMVPFYGQGMNAGLEDVRTLYDWLDRFVPPVPALQDSKVEESQYILVNGSAEERAKQREKALAEYSRFRRPDAHAINDLALRNYQEMRSDVKSPIYRLRKAVEERLSVWLPSLGIATQYSRVSFGNERYSVVDKVVQKQGKVLLAGMTSALVGTMGFVAWLALRMNRMDSSPKETAIWVGRRIKDMGRRFV
ncbi:hypothetical protein B0J12DRAFT_113485 [Macrophomina phaseolina]|uniref:FAD-binding domain-containing protein n=1 Tax=Macrophomina phaseolina TaxID=35725 RepID=A0ABQ8G8P9_9PEZI|nr:hypothetical protein B0J12DRAFT_113485 [Macrophomina phaseolina]